MGPFIGIFLFLTLLNLVNFYFINISIHRSSNFYHAGSKLAVKNSLKISFGFFTIVDNEFCGISNFWSTEKNNNVDLDFKHLK